LNAFNSKVGRGRENVKGIFELVQFSTRTASGVRLPGLVAWAKTHREIVPAGVMNATIVRAGSGPS
jgi:hypothetical protein